MTKRRVHPEPRRRWTAEEDAYLRASYPDVPMPALLAALPGRTIRGIYQRVTMWGLKRSAVYLASPAACRLRRGGQVGAPYRFMPGQTPANKGLRRPGWGPGRMKETQFKKGARTGAAARLYKPIGSERLTKDGYRQRKVNDALPLQQRWRFVHLLVWEAAHGPVPSGHAVVFVNGDRTDVRLENLTLVTRGALMRRNTIHNFPEPIPQLVQLRGALIRKINRRTRQEAESHAE